MNTAPDEQLDQLVRDQLIQRKGNWASVVQGSGVSYSWISKFVNGHIHNPGYGTLRDLSRFLTSLDNGAEGVPAVPVDELRDAA